MTDYITPDEYLKAERVSEAKAEYVAGEIVARQGASLPHAEIVGNIQVVLRLALKDRSCRAVTNDIKVKSEQDKYFYPDVLVFCDEPIYDRGMNDVLLNPTVIIEVLSKTTQDWDRGSKFEYCRRIETLTDYILVSQDKCLVEHRERQSPTLWTMHYVEGMDKSIHLKSISVDLTLSDIYEHVL
jgi:Uma2 family endonuclease